MITIAINKANIQVYTTMPRELVKEIDADGKKNHRSRSKQIAYIVEKYYIENPVK